MQIYLSMACAVRSMQKTVAVCLSQAANVAPVKSSGNARVCALCSGPICPTGSCHQQHNRIPELVNLSCYHRTLPDESTTACDNADNPSQLQDRT